MRQSTRFGESFVGSRRVTAGYAPCTATPERRTLGEDDMAEQETCPYLVQVMVDHLWLYPVTTYCTSGERTRVPAATRISEVCVDATHTRCPGYVDARRKTALCCVSERPDLRPAVTRSPAGV
jgi:hypothetical protein